MQRRAFLSSLAGAVVGALTPKLPMVDPLPQWRTIAVPMSVEFPRWFIGTPAYVAYYEWVSLETIKLRHSNDAQRAFFEEDPNDPQR